MYRYHREGTQSCLNVGVRPCVVDSHWLGAGCSQPPDLAPVGAGACIVPKWVCPKRKVDWNVFFSVTGPPAMAQRPHLAYHLLL